MALSRIEGGSGATKVDTAPTSQTVKRSYEKLLNQPAPTDAQLAQALESLRRERAQLTNQPERTYVKPEHKAPSPATMAILTGLAEANAIPADIAASRSVSMQPPKLAARVTKAAVASAAQPQPSVEKSTTKAAGLKALHNASWAQFDAIRGA